MVTVPTLEQKVLLGLLSGEITGTFRLKKGDLKAVDWNGVLREATQQAVPLMAAEGAVQYKQYIADFTPWKYAIAAAHTANARLEYGEQELNKLMEGHPFVILKGMAAACYYPKPYERCLGDIDFLIEPTQRTEIEKLLVSNGYHKGKIEQTYHASFYKDKVHLEMHFEIAGIPRGKSGERIREFMTGAAKRGHEAEFDSFCFPVPDDFTHGLVILLHMQHHMHGTGLGLRHICDWACYLQKTENEPFWTQFIDLLAEIGLLTYAQVITKSCAVYFHTHCPKWAEKADEQLCADFMNDILTGGNFGKKDKTRESSGMMISHGGKNGEARGKISSLFWTLHNSTAARYPIVKKCPLLYPVLDGWRIVLFVFKVMRGKRASLIKTASEANQRKSVYDRLHIFETDGKK